MYSLLESTAVFGGFSCLHLQVTKVNGSGKEDIGKGLNKWLDLICLFEIK
jgi:hypothetical protein